MNTSAAAGGSLITRRFRPPYQLPPYQLALSAAALSAAALSAAALSAAALSAAALSAAFFLAASRILSGVRAARVPFADHVSQVLFNSSVTPPHTIPLPSFFKQAYPPLSLGAKYVSPSSLQCP